MEETTEYTPTTELAYRNHPAISASDINYFIDRGPLKFSNYKYNRQDPITSSGFRLGTAFDDYIFDFSSWPSKYVVQEDGMVTPSSNQQKKFVDLVSSGTDPVEAYKACYKTLKKKDKEIENLSKKLKEELDPWMDFYTEINDRVILGREDFDKILLMKDNLVEHPRGYMLTSDANDTTIFNQHPLIWEFSAYGMTLKGLLDRVYIDHETKTVYIIDLKTTIASWPEFKAVRFKKYGYHIQAVMYTRGARKKLLVGDLTDYNLVYELAVCQTGGTFEVHFWRFLEDSLAEFDEEVDINLYRISEHLKRGIWNRTLAELTNPDCVETYGEENW